MAFKISQLRGADVLHNPHYGNSESQMYDGVNHQSVYEIEIPETLIRKIIKGNPTHKLILGRFKIKYPKTKRLVDLELSISPNGSWKCSHTSYCSFLLHLNSKRFQTNISRAINMNYIIYCKDLKFDTWRSIKLTKNQKSEIIAYEKFEMKRFKDWYVNFKNGNITHNLKFGIIIKNMQLIDQKYHRNAKIITLSNFNYNQRYYKFRWEIDKNEIKMFKQYKIHQWYRSPIQFCTWYFVLYPKSDIVIEHANPQYVQAALDLVTVPKSIHGIECYYNAVILETYSHFTNVKTFFQSEEKCLSQAANANLTKLKCEHLLKLNTITIEVEIYVFRPMQYDKNVNYKELFVTYWDRNCELSQIKLNPPNLDNIKGNFEWKICNNYRGKYDIFDHFVNALNGQRFFSNMFEIGHLKWCLMAFPNGETLEEKHFVKLQLFLSDTTPTNLATIWIRFQLYCREFRVYQTGIMKFEHNANENKIYYTPRWNPGILNIKDVIKETTLNCEKQITFGVNAEILQVQNLKHEIIYSRNFKFKLNTNISMKLEIKTWANDLFAYKDKIFDNMWIVSYFPIPFQLEKNNGQFAFMLYSLPVGISKVTVLYQYRYMGVIIWGETKELYYDNNNRHIAGKFINLNTNVMKLFENMSAQYDCTQTNFEINIRIVALEDVNGNVMRFHSEDSNELYMFSMYLKKYQKNYLDSLYYLRKAYYCTKILISDSVMNRKLYLKQKRKLNKAIKKNRKLFVNGIYAKIKHKFCSNARCNRVDTNINGKFIKKFKTCKGCSSVMYCSKACQKMHWNMCHRWDCLCRTEIPNFHHQFRI
eukprot:294699_1